MLVHFHPTTKVQIALGTRAHWSLKYGMEGVGWAGVGAQYCIVLEVFKLKDIEELFLLLMWNQDEFLTLKECDWNHWLSPPLFWYNTNSL